MILYYYYIIIFLWCCLFVIFFCRWLSACDFVWLACVAWHGGGCAGCVGWPTRCVLAVFSQVPSPEFAPVPRKSPVRVAVIVWLLYGILRFTLRFTLRVYTMLYIIYTILYMPLYIPHSLNIHMHSIDESLNQATTIIILYCAFYVITLQ